MITRQSYFSCCVISEAENNLAVFNQNVGWIFSSYDPLFYTVYEKVSELSVHELKSMNTKYTLIVSVRSHYAYIS
jgi:hypothetical protein